MFDVAKRLDRLLRDAAASKHELRIARAQFAAVLEEQQYKRREAERHLVEAVHRIKAMLPPQEGVELDWPQIATRQPCRARGSSYWSWTRHEQGCSGPVHRGTRGGRAGATARFCCARPLPTRLRVRHHRGGALISRRP
jgi:threonine aldolase